MLIIMSNMVLHGTFTCVKLLMKHWLWFLMKMFVPNTWLVRLLPHQCVSYSHLIKEITITNDYGEPGKNIVTVITSHSDIMDFIDISANDINLIKKFREAVIEFINQQTKIVYGVPVANETEETHELSNSIVPINPVMLFFILTGRIYQSLGN